MEESTEGKGGRVGNWNRRYGKTWILEKVRKGQFFVDTYSCP